MRTNYCGGKVYYIVHGLQTKKQNKKQKQNNNEKTKINKVNLYALITCAECCALLITAYV